MRRAIEGRTALVPQHPSRIVFRGHMSQAKAAKLVILLCTKGGRGGEPMGREFVGSVVKGKLR